jgi:hypothetical protein
MTPLHETDDERGAVLVIALIFMIVGGVLAVALTSLSSTNLVNTSNYQNLRIVNYAADGAMDGAIQQVRYHGACENFPKSGSFQLTSNQYVLVTCSQASMPIITALETAGSSTLTSPSSSFSSAYAITGQPVVNSAGTIIGSIISANGSTARMSVTATSSGTVYVGEQGQRFDTFTACTSTTSLATCTSPELTTQVLFGDINTSASPPTAAAGYTSTIESWVVTDANA